MNPLLQLFKRKHLTAWVLLSQIGLVLTGLPVSAQSPLNLDSLIVAEIQEKLANDSRMPVTGISISAVNGMIRLRGVVQTLAQKQWAQEIAYQVQGVKVVDNQIWVDRGRIKDAELKKIIEKKLQQQGASLYRRVRVDVVEGEVTLKGEVSSWGVKHMAEEVISLIRGVGKITNRLKIRDPRVRSDEDIKNAVEQALRRKIQMNHDFYIRVSVVRGVVTLKGRVRSDTDRRIAIQTVLFVPGVADLVDRLEILPE